MNFLKKRCTWKRCTSAAKCVKVHFCGYCCNRRLLIDKNRKQRMCIVVAWVVGSISRLESYYLRCGWIKKLLLLSSMYVLQTSTNTYLWHLVETVPSTFDTVFISNRRFPFEKTDESENRGNVFLSLETKKWKGGGKEERRAREETGAYIASMLSCRAIIGQIHRRSRGWLHDERVRVVVVNCRYRQ